MKIIRSVLRSANIGSSHHFQRAQVIRAFSAIPFPGSDDNRNSNSLESPEEFEQRIFSDMARPGTPSLSSFYQKLDKAEKTSSSGFSSTFSFGNRSFDGLDESFNTLSDGMDDKLKKAATYFDYDPEEISKDDYTYRPDMNFWSGNTYDVKDLDLNKPGIRKPFKRNEFETTSEEVLRKADFRNVRFLVNFITEAGIIIKRSKTGISAKAQRKVAREIKTARAFGLMPFTTMGTKQFIYGKTMENQDEDYAYEAYERNFVEDEVEI